MPPRRCPTIKVPVDKSMNNHNHRDSRDDSRRRLIAVKHGLFADEDRECYWVRHEARFNVLSLVSIDTAMGVAQPKP
ncbi:hypothetical protein PanWU01x14_318740 [Parasponia andersonii]|uniref:Uncharacterized protein n=1 Tax=Parasponia andersonii TaxID=3476 RepID=A0A2P5AMB4_PARAD|nr:hypothetical protein PanWU01x14_318740 [Parasponia andersonii]